MPSSTLPVAPRLRTPNSLTYPVNRSLDQLICKYCQTEIADKALICYRCGRSTTEPRIAPPSMGSLFEHKRRSRTPLIVAAVILVLVVLLLAWFLWPAPSRVGRSMFESPSDATSIIEVRILHEQVDMSWMML